ncbi:ATP synthase F1 subunit delta [Candidatus Zinderia endosymbiont of Aphrophora alni]|uniref:ATP synthase F1 subunit delta n=1 Tax=Candidatus Zinderia endosymbiont of Aphrophora alni TaxID=3077951 RepID=UPI0030D05CE6
MIKDDFYLYFYSRALFEIVITEELVVWLKLIKKLKQILICPEIINFLKNSFISFKHKFLILLNFLDQDIINNKKIINFIKILIKNKRIIFFSKIVNFFFLLINIYKNVKNIKIVTAYILSKKQILNLIYKIEKFFCCKIKYKIIINKSIIGGIFIIINDNIYDVSIKNNLNILFKILSN